MQVGVVDRPFISIQSHTWYQPFRARSPANPSELLAASCDLYFCKPSQESALVALQWSNQERCKPSTLSLPHCAYLWKWRGASTAVLSSSANKGKLSGFIIVQLRCSRAGLLVLISCWQGFVQHSGTIWSKRSNRSRWSMWGWSWCMNHCQHGCGLGGMSSPNISHALHEQELNL